MNDLERENIRTGLPRAAEAVLACAVLALVAPLLVLVALAILVTDGAPVIFRQERVGRGGRLFRIYKLRTMRASIGPQVTSADDVRVTRLGRLLRRAKIDELPALWNVIKGDMALVGPRPEVPRYVALDDPRWRAVLAVRPGLTDPVTVQLRDEERLLAQVRGDRERFYLERLQPLKLEAYLRYLQRRSWRSDLWVLFLTFIAIISSRIGDDFHELGKASVGRSSSESL
jgi:lipopolysaccharide/colanic/teichoic acid biosynthesis glycosyltransferase